MMNAILKSLFIVLPSILVVFGFGFVSHVANRLPIASIVVNALLINRLRLECNLRELFEDLVSGEYSPSIAIAFEVVGEYFAYRLKQ